MRKSLELVVLAFGLAAAASSSVHAEAKGNAPPTRPAGREAKLLRLTDSGTAEVVISGRGTVLSFPTKPTKVILGKANTFGVEYVDSDLAISPLNPTARSHLFVYMSGRRFSFDLITSIDDAGAVILVRDAREITVEVRP